MLYEESLNYLYNQLPYFSRIGAAAYKKDIGNTILLCDILGNPQHQFRSIHIAGTNGKGSTSHMLAAIFQAHGYKTGLYTSPHLVDFRERIRINGEMISRDAVAAFVTKMKAHCEKIQPSFFELTVAMAFEYFAHEKVDIAIIETGLGGRLDSTNIIQPLLSIITNIGLDHTNLLGNTMESIAFEKAGIIKNHTPVVVGHANPITKAVFDQKANTCKINPIYAEETLEVFDTKKDDGYLACTLKNKKSGEMLNISTDLSGLYQTENIRTVFAAINVLKENKIQLENEKCLHALRQVKKLTGLMGRWDILSLNPLVIADVAHNEDGIKKVLYQLQQDYSKNKKHFVIGFVADKDISKILSLFPKHANFYFTQAHIPRALDKQQLAEQAKAFDLNGSLHENVEDALSHAVKKAEQNDVILICGSFFTLAELEHYSSIGR